jgi:hypothetical protein
MTLPLSCPVQKITNPAKAVTDAGLTLPPVCPPGAALTTLAPPQGGQVRGTLPF